MKIFCSVMLAYIAMSLPMLVQAEISKVHIKKVEQDLYQTSDGSYIQTNNCYVDANGKDAVLTFEKYACNNHLQFNAQTQCEVLEVF